MEVSSDDVSVFLSAYVSSVSQSVDVSVFLFCDTCLCMFMSLCVSV
jgi:hypothetical protein